MDINFIQQSITEMKKNLNLERDREGAIRLNAEELFDLMENIEDTRFETESKDRVFKYMHGQTVLNAIPNTEFPKGMLEIRIGHWVGVFNYKENKNG